MYEGRNKVRDDISITLADSWVSPKTHVSKRNNVASNHIWLEGHPGWMMSTLNKMETLVV